MKGVLAHVGDVIVVVPAVVVVVLLSPVTIMVIGEKAMTKKMRRKRVSVRRRFWKVMGAEGVPEHIPGILRGEQGGVLNGRCLT